jgi:excisionase family DNA binding protein
MDELWDISRVATYLGVTERTVYNKVRAGDLPAVKVGRLWRVRAADLEGWLARGRGAISDPAVPTPIPVTSPGTFERGPYPYTEDAGRSAIAAEPGALPPRAELEAMLDGIDELVGRRLRFVALLTKAVVALGWRAPVIVGGCAVQYYTSGNYPTLDIDLVGASEPVAQVLESWGFLREGRHWYDSDLKLAVEVPGRQLDPHEAARVFGVRIEGVTAYVLGIEDLIIDRLNACVHWNDVESCRWARTMLLTAPELDDAYLDERAAVEQVFDKLCELRVEP